MRKILVILLDDQNGKDEHVQECLDHHQTTYAVIEDYAITEERFYKTW
jgi:hypothetical protein